MVGWFVDQAYIKEETCQIAVWQVFEENVQSLAAAGDIIDKTQFIVS
jgi:hypothetical protein